MALVLALASCARSEPAPQDASKKPATQQRVSAKLGYSWTLPQGWEFVPLEALGVQPDKLSIDTFAAQRRASPRALTQVLATDVISTVPGREAADNPDALQSLERYGREALAGAGVEHIEAERVRMGRRTAVEVSGRKGDTAYSLRLVYVGRRRFEFRCFAPFSAGGWPCEEAYGSFEIADLPRESQDSEKPRILHLRDERFGLEFDAPSDEWQAIGPRTGGGGAQVVWVWSDGRQHQIDVHALDVSQVRVPKAPDEDVFAEKIADGERARGAKVKVERSTLAGVPCHHLVIDRADGWAQDNFLLLRGATSYGLLITQRTRDTRLIEKIKKGYRFTAN